MEYYNALLKYNRNGHEDKFIIRDLRRAFFNGKGAIG